MGGKAAEKLIQTKLNKHPSNADANLALSKIDDSDLSSIFPKKQGVFPKSSDKSVIGRILNRLASKNLVDTSYIPQYILGSTRLAAYKVYGNVPTSRSETPEIIQKAAKKKTSYGDLDLDLVFSGDKKEIVRAIEEIDPSSFAAFASAEIHVAVKLSDNRVIQIDLVDFAERGREFALMQTSSFVDLAQNIKGVFHAVLIWATVHGMRVESSDKIDAILKMAQENPEQDFAKAIEKKKSLGWEPIKTKFSLRPSGIVIAIIFKKGNSISSVPVNINPKADYRDYDILAKAILQDEGATKEEILHTLPLAKFVKQNKDAGTINEIWSDFIDMMSKRVRDKISPEDYSLGVESIKSILFKGSLNESSLLLEGGLGGHIMNLYEDTTLSFNKLLDVLSKAGRGKIVGTEKTDGFNVFLSLKDGVSRFARNKSDIKSGGMTLKDLSVREFAGGKSIKNIYMSAFKAYDKAVKNLNRKAQKKLFNNGQIWYNAEIQGPNEFTIINYDRNIITIHSTLHLKYNEKTQTFETFTDPVLYKFLDKQIDAMEQQITGKNFKVQTAAFMNLRDLSDGTDFNIVKSQIKKELSAYNLTPTNTIGDYMFTKIYAVVNKKMPEISTEIKELVANNLIGRAKLTGPDGLPKGTPKELRQRISAIKKDSKNILTDAISPIELAVHEFSVQLLHDLESLFIMDNEGEVQRLQKTVKSAIDSIKSSNDANAIEVLIRHLTKIKKVENINTAVEGFVFDYNGQTYKFTGNFTPIHKILTLFRKVATPQKENEEIQYEDLEEDGPDPSEMKDIYALWPGGFKPPHGGHYNAVKSIVEKYGVDKAYVLISPKERASHSADKRISISADMSLEIWKIYTRNDDNIEARVASVASPVQSAYNFVDQVPEGSKIILGVGAKDIEAGDTRFKGAMRLAKEKGIKVELAPMPSVIQISGTEMRDFILHDQSEEFKKFLPKHLAPEEMEQVWRTVNNPDNQDIFEGSFQANLKRTHPAEKERVIGGGPPNSEPYDDDFPKARGKSAPPIGEAMSPEQKLMKGFIEVVKQHFQEWDEEWDYNTPTDYTKTKFKKYPNLFKACKKYGPNVVNKYLKMLSSWTTGGKEIQKKKYTDIMVQGIPILKMINPIKHSPKWLFRGIRLHGKIPKPGQPIVYTTKKAASSWTSEFDVASTDFAGSNHGGVVLAVPYSHMMKHGDVFLWEVQYGSEMNDSDIAEEFGHESEWAVRLHTPMPVPAIYYSALEDEEDEEDEYGYSQDFVKKAKAFKKPLKEEDKSASGFQKVPIKGDDPFVISDDGEMDEEISEMSAMSGGAVAGASEPWGRKREDFIDELNLREHIRKRIEENSGIIKEKSNFQQIPPNRDGEMNEMNKEMLKEELRLRRYIRKMLNEVGGDDDIPHHNTGINVLEELLKKILPVLEESYKTLTSDFEQRKSFRAHIINAIISSLAPERVREKAATPEDAIGEGPLGEEEISVSVGTTGDGVTPDETPEIGPEGFIDIDKDKDAAKASAFALPDEEGTGRNLSMQTFEKIEKQILDSYAILEDEEDSKTFYDYLLTNVKLYFDKFEKELQPALNEPTTPEYEEEKEEVEDDMAGADDNEEIKI